LRGNNRPKWLEPQRWRDIPRLMTLRELTFAVPIKGFRTKSVTLATSLLDHRQWPKEAFADLYRKRWMAELFLRDIKTSMGADVLRCRTPSMLEKELEMFMLAYNLTRAVMCQAADRHGVDRFCLSFKGTVATIRQWAVVIAVGARSIRRREEMKELLLLYVAWDQIPHRPNRTEPRAVKRRPKPFSFLTKMRSEYKELPHRNHYKKPLS
jgi:hypothetical protein